MEYFEGISSDTASSSSPTPATLAAPTNADGAREVGVDACPTGTVSTGVCLTGVVGTDACSTGVIGTSDYPTNAIGVDSGKDRSGRGTPRSDTTSGDVPEGDTSMTHVGAQHPMEFISSPSNFDDYMIDENHDKAPLWFHTIDNLLDELHFTTMEEPSSFKEA
ncbi:hypothetical protein GUJ93_ZPchr0009g733 [Zizania palustris]|uniref:Uncharacterized protein n=1 Tax=Zizania palustris TaxID=103762 RepID=A0A8J5S3I2_ZIZPA|nr:hypothetical protein GUJ93_ZPchr0009g733 [Zizania palustris]